MFTSPITLTIVSVKWLSPQAWSQPSQVEDRNKEEEITFFFAVGFLKCSIVFYIIKVILLGIVACNNALHVLHHPQESVFWAQQATAVQLWMRNCTIHIQLLSTFLGTSISLMKQIIEFEKCLFLQALSRPSLVSFDIFNFFHNIYLTIKHNKIMFCFLTFPHAFLFCWQVKISLIAIYL